MEFTKTFGLNPLLLLAQIVNFLILLYLLNRFLYKPVLKVLKDRQERIQTGIDDAKKGEEFLENAKLETQKILKNATMEAQKIVEEGRLETDELRQRFEEKMKLEEEQLLKEARQTIEEDRSRMEKALMGQVSQVAVSVLKRVIGEVVGAKDKEKIAKYSQRLIIKHLSS